MNHRLKRWLGHLTLQELAMKKWRETTTALIMFGDRFASWLAARLGLGKVFMITWGVVDYLFGMALMFLRFAPFAFFVSTWIRLYHSPASTTSISTWFEAWPSQ
jgi:hypothetical protein